MTDRALSTVVGYAIMLTVIAILTSGLILGTTAYVDGQRRDVARTELTVVGNHLAADLTTADALAATLAPNGSATVTADLADFVVGGSYHVSVRETERTDEYAIRLRSDRTDVTTTVPVVTDHPISTGRVEGGTLTIAVTDGHLEVRND